MLPDERMVEAAWAALPGDDFAVARGALLAAFAALDREALIKVAQVAIGGHLVVPHEDRRALAEAVLRAVGLLR